MPRRQRKGDWVVAGGKHGELAHCTRCGVGLVLSLPQPIPIVVAAGKAFVKMHEHCKEGMYVPLVPKTPQEWLTGRDTGTSSLTIYSVMTGVKMPRYDVPLDGADFGRCYRLLKLFPEWQARMHEVAIKFPAWKRLYLHWAELSALCEANEGAALSAEIKRLTA